jgi:prefoldin subunit 5
MTIDERLERLADRHEALSNTVELLTHDIDALRAEGKETGEKIRALAVIAEQNEVCAGQMMGAITSLEANAAQMMDAITRLARVGDNHEDRINDIEN